MMKRTLWALALSLMPLLVRAQGSSELKDAKSVFDLLLDLGNKAIYLLVAFAIVYIVWYVVVYFIKASSDRGEAGLRIMWGIIGLFVIVSIWGLVNILVGTFATDNRAPVDRFPFPGDIVSEKD